MSTDLEITVSRELAAFSALRAAYDAECVADPDFACDLAEGETDLMEAVDTLAHAELLDTALIEALEKSVDALAARKERFHARRAARRAILEQVLVMLERSTLERPTATLTLAKRPAQLRVDDEAAIPALYFRAGPPRLDKAALKAALAEGQAVPGATLEPAPATLTIRRR